MSSTDNRPCHRPRRKLLAKAAVIAALLPALGACGTDKASPTTTSFPKVDPDQRTVSANFTVAPGVLIATASNAEPHHKLTIVNSKNEKLQTLITDDLGQANFAYISDRYRTYTTGGGSELPSFSGTELQPGNYTIRDESVDPVAVTKPFKVLARDDHPNPKIYDQNIADGFGYVAMRDGVQLSINVRLPGPIDKGPYPTVIEYSGYGPSNPNSTEPGSTIAQLLGGFATVGVNMRGTGCSGGVFDVFNPAQQADGYDVVETIARQPWVKGNKVGMVGLSYSGITQLYVGATTPPHLAAITPLSVIGDAWQMAWPGGIYNKGFTEQWLAERNKESASEGSDWVKRRTEDGDMTCADNLRIRKQNPDFGEFTRALENRPADADGRDLEKLVSSIKVPVLLSGAWQDEQTGPRFASMLGNFTGTDNAHFVLFNGRHPDGYSTLVLNRWMEFLSLYVADEVPHIPEALRNAAPAVLGSNFRVPDLTLEPDRFTHLANGDLAAARELFEADPKVRVLFESGAGDPANPGSPKPRFSAAFDAWPPPQAMTETLYLTEGGTLASKAGEGDPAEHFKVDLKAGDKTIFKSQSDYDLLAPIWKTDWQNPRSGDALSYLTEPFKRDTVYAGAGYADLWVSTKAPDVDLQVTISIVDSAGHEFMIQAGQLRASHRAMDGQPDENLELKHLWDAAHRKDLEPDEWTQIAVPIPVFAQAFRAGDRLRVTVSSPGRDRATWRFATTGRTGDVIRLGLGGKHTSALHLSTIEGLEIPAGNVPCPSLRGQPCRTYKPIPR